MNLAQESFLSACLDQGMDQDDAEACLDDASERAPSQREVMPEAYVVSFSQSVRRNARRNAFNSL